MANYVGRDSVTCAVLGKKAHLQSHMDEIYSQDVQATRRKLPNTYTLRYTHIYTYSGPTHGEEDHPRRSSLFENNENSAAAWCCTAGRGSAGSTQESLWRRASHLAAVVAECRQRARMINSYSFSICKKKPSVRPLWSLWLWMLSEGKHQEISVPETGRIPG